MDQSTCYLGLQIIFQKEASFKMNMHRKLSLYCLFSLVLLCSGCGTHMDVKPDVPGGQVDFTLRGKVTYEGNWDYVPKTISNQSADNGSLSFNYAYNVLYGGTAMQQDIVAILLPTTMLGAPTGESDVQVRAKLDVMNGSNLIKSYIAACNMTRPRGVFTGGTNFTEIRKRGLMAVKENIELQMVQDRDFWNSFLNNKKGEIK